MSKMQFTYDEEGKELLLKDGRYQVMMAWEKPYMEACIDAIEPSGDVLEVGFGLGYASTRIQHYKPRSHTIIECDPVVAKRAREWASKYSGVTIIEKTWQEALSELGQFDAIFFDDYPLEEAGTFEMMQKKVEEASPFVREGKRKMEKIAREIPYLKTIKYTDFDLELFLREMPQHEREQAPLFLIELYQNGQISREQLEKHVSKEILVDLERPEKKAGFSRRADRLFQFLNPCLEKHMRIGCRFSCYLEDSTSKYENPLFQEIILDPFLDYKEKWIEVEVPLHCRYYNAQEALIMTITKRG